MSAAPTLSEEDFSTALVATARKYLYVRETNGSNSDGGGFIDQSLASLGLSPGASWCAWVKETATVTGVTIKFRRSASGLNLLKLNPDLVVTDPQPGDILIEDHGHGMSHVGIITDVIKVDGEIDAVATIAGNTSSDGLSRNGDRVAEHALAWWPAPSRVAGYLRISISAPSVPA